MAAPLQATYMGRLYDGLCQAMLQALKGEPIVVGDGDEQMVLRSPSGEIERTPPKAALLKEIREFLKDNGIDREPINTEAIHEVAGAITKYDDEFDALLAPPEAK